MRKHLFVYFLLLPLLAWCLEVTPSFRHYTTLDGLPSNCIRDIAQDSCGFVWFATNDGLARFDGRKMRVFKPALVPGFGSADNFVASMVQSRGYIWLATDNGLLVYNRRLERLELPPLRYSEGVGEITGNIRGIAADASGNVWVAMGWRGVYRISPDFVVCHYDVPDRNHGLGTVFVDRRGDVWVTGAHNSEGLYRYYPDSDGFRPEPMDFGGSPIPLKAMAMTEDADNRFWIGLWPEGLICYDPVLKTARQVHADVPGRFFHIHSISTLSGGDLLIGADGGLVMYDPVTGRSQLFEHDELRGNSLSGRFVYPIMADDEGGVWIGTFYAGVNYMPPPIKHFEAERHSRFVNSVSGSIIAAFCEDGEGNIYIGSDDGGLCRYNPSTREYRHISLGSATEYDNIHALCLDGDNLWIGTYGGGVKVYDTARGRLVHDFSRDFNGSGAGVTSGYAIFRDKRENIWVGTMEEIFCFDRRTGVFEKVRDVGALVCDITQDSAGNLWFSTQGRGLLRFDPVNGQWKDYTCGNEAGYLPNNHVYCTEFDSRGNMWVATGNGLVRYRPASDDFENTDIGEEYNVIYIVKAWRDELWLGTGNGLLRYRPGEDYDRFTTMDGIVCNQFSPNASLMVSDGRIYMGTVDGFTWFYPDRIGTNTVVPALRFTDLEIGGRHVDVGDPKLPCSLNALDVLELGPEDYAFSISFAALSFANPEGNSYMYMLEGFDREWMEAGSSGKATYTNLPPGDYTMLVKASNNDRVWNTAGISLPIHIAPPWYAAWPVRVALVVIVVLLVVIGILVTMRRNESKHRAELRRISEAKEKEANVAKLSFFTTIAHEIRTPVSLIIGPLENIMQSSRNFTPQENDDIDIIYRNSQRLLCLVNQLLDFKKVEQLALAARFEPVDIPALVESTAKRFRPSMKQRGVNLELDMPDKGFRADVDTEALTKLLSNLLNNARKFTRTRVEVKCGLTDDGTGFFIRVADDGIGISEEDRKRIFQPFVQVSETDSGESGTGLGLSIVMKVVKAHDGTIDVRSEPGAGSVFTVTLPLHHAKAEDEDCVIAEENEAHDVSVPENAPEQTEAADAPEGEKPVMLVVDDSRDLLHFMMKNFSGEYNVVCAASGEEALERMSCQNFDIIVSDWMMPGMSGVDLCRSVRASMDTSHIPFVLLTARTDNFSKIEGMECGADAYVEKPFSTSYLKARLKNLAEMRGLLRRKFSQMPLEPIESLAPTQLDSDFLKTLTGIIEENFSNPELSVDYIARHMGVSRSGLYAKIKTLANITPNELIQITRLKRAAQLLAEGRHRISEICYMVGFNSPSYFAKCFQKQFGMKPGEFTPHTRE